MAIDMYLVSMKVKETSKDRILGYFIKDGEWSKVQGDSAEEFIKNIKKCSRIEREQVLFQKKHMEYFDTLIPSPTVLSEEKYAQVQEAYNKLQLS